MPPELRETEQTSSRPNTALLPPRKTPLITRKLARRHARKASGGAWGEAPTADLQSSAPAMQIRVAGVSTNRQDAQTPVYPPPGALAALMEQWQAEDASLSEEEKEQADRDTSEFKANMNANREATGEKLIYP